MPKHGAPILLALPALLVLAGRVGAAVVPADPSFALRLHHELATGSGNAFFSPYSVVSVVAMAAQGAYGETVRQMEVAMGSDAGTVAKSQAALRARIAVSGKPYELSAANALWVDRSFRLSRPYVAAASSRWDAGIFDEDFRGAAEPARERINRWVAMRTRERIRDLLPVGAVDASTRLVLTNAVYFKSPWAHVFLKNGTATLPFTRADGSRVDVPMMRADALPAGFAALDGVRLLEMNYRGGDLSMVVILPDGADGLPAVERRLDAKRLARWLEALREQEVAVSFPRFRLESTWELKPALSALGMPIAFDPARADLSGVGGEGAAGRLYISAVVHKAFVEVEEEGTEAAAATGVVMSATSVRSAARPEFIADHPFLFLIRERASGAILFMGRMGDPRGM